LIDDLKERLMKKDSTAYGKDRPSWDKSDCSVRALATAVGCTYEQASAVYTAAGRRVGKPTPVEITYKVMGDWLGLRSLDGVRGMQLQELAELAKAGRYVVHLRNHALAVVEGVVQDWDSLDNRRAKVETVWRMTPEALGKMERLKKLWE
jgi:hypothetical protein